jgi:hypothetical protein
MPFTLGKQISVFTHFVVEAICTKPFPGKQNSENNVFELN